MTLVLFIKSLKNKLSHFKNLLIKYKKILKNIYKKNHVFDT